MIRSILYQSRPTTDFPSLVDQDILETAYHRNRANQITGYLVRTPSHYFQYLEGPCAALDALTADIQYDQRHDRFEPLQQEAVSSRGFRNWAMGYHLVSEQDRDELVGWQSEGNAFAAGMIAYMEKTALRREARSPMYLSVK